MTLPFIYFATQEIAVENDALENLFAGGNVFKSLWQHKLRHIKKCYTA